MNHHVAATYEDGVLRLAHPLPIENRKQVDVTVLDIVRPAGRWAAVDMKTGEILLYADSVKEARDSGRALGRGEPLIRWVSDEPELPWVGL